MWFLDLIGGLFLLSIGMSLLPAVGVILGVFLIWISGGNVKK